MRRVGDCASQTRPCVFQLMINHHLASEIGDKVVFD